MNPLRTKLIQRIDELIDKGNEALKHESAHKWIDSVYMTTFTTAALSFIEKTYGKDDLYYSSFNYQTRSYTPSDIKRGIAILLNLREEIEGGWDMKIKSLLSSELFVDFFEMANYLLDEAYKDAAAVILGSILEGHLRHLCKENGIELESEKDGKKRFLAADQQNIELAKIEKYGKLDQKQVTTWLELRNNAAHGRYDEYTIDQVKNMSTGLMEFISRTT